jgi:hypothetical protein
LQMDASIFEECFASELLIFIYKITYLNPRDNTLDINHCEILNEIVLTIILINKNCFLHKQEILLPDRNIYVQATSQSEFHLAKNPLFCLICLWIV